MKTKALFLIPLVLMLACSNDDGDPSGVASFNGTISTYAGSTFGYEGDGGQAAAAKLGYVTGVSIDAAGNVYVTDAAANTIRKINASNKVISTIAGKFLGFNVINPNNYSGDGGPATAANFNVPWSAVADPSGNLFVSDRGNNVLRKIDGTGNVSTIAGKVISHGASGDNGPAVNALINQPEGLATDAAGNLYFSDTQNHTIRKISTTGEITTIAGLPGQPGYSGDGGQATAAKLSGPAGVAVDASGNIYFSDNNAVIRRISVTGKITTIAGTGIEGYSGDGGKATEAMLLAPKGIVMAKDGSIVFADASNNRIRRISPELNIIETIAGTGEAGYAGDGGLAVNAKLSNPQGLAVDSEGNIYIAESGSSVIRIITWEK